MIGPHELEDSPAGTPVPATKAGKAHLATLTYPLRVGQVVECIFPVEFVTGSSHNVGDKLTVTEETLPYYSFYLGLSYKVAN